MSDVAAPPLHYELEISEDLLEASLTIPRGTHEEVPDAETLAAWLGEHEGLVGIDLEALDALLELVEEGKKAGPVVVARGTEPTAGRDARLEWRGDFFESLPLERPDGSVDHFRRNKTSVDEHTVIASWLPPEVGQPGRTVKGETIPAEAGEIWYPQLHETVAWVDESKTEIETLVGGQVEYARGKVSVSQLYAVKSVDFGSSSIDFDGAVAVSGDVQEGFEVHATGSVEISGYIETAPVSAGGNLTVVKGIIGRNKIKVSCGADMEVGFARELEIDCGGQLLSNGELLFCTAKVGGDVTAARNRLVGGHWQIGGSLYVNELGSESETPTVVNVGLDADLEAKQAEQLAEREKLQAEIAQREQQVENLDRKRKRTEKEEIALSKLKMYVKQLKQKDKEAADRDRLMRQRLKMRRRYGTIWVIEGIHPGVRIYAGGKPQPLEVTDFLKGPLRVGYLPGRTTPAVTHGRNKKFESLF